MAFPLLVYSELPAGLLLHGAQLVAPVSKYSPIGQSAAEHFRSNPSRLVPSFVHARVSYVPALHVRQEAQRHSPGFFHQPALHFHLCEHHVAWAPKPH